MSDPLDHVLLTRFNLPSIGAESVVRAREGWLRDRVELFEQYCLRSVAQQTNQHFYWIVYLDPASPRWLRDRIEGLCSDGIFIPIFRTSVRPQDLVSDMRSVTGAQYADLLTTNLDNDDGIASDFVERLQQVAVTDRPTAIYFACGVIKSGSKLFHHTDRCNAFCSVRADWNSSVTCWADWHNLLGRLMPVREIEGEPGWLQVIHDHNVSNRIRGRRVAPESYRKTFDGLLDDVVTPRSLDIVADTVLARPKRYIKESGRAVVKQAVMTTVGKEGLDRLKHIRASRM